jgi:hypothetical protein
MARSPNRPRISANDLALYMVSSATTQLSIIRRAADPQTFVTTRYKDVRELLRTFLADPARNVNRLHAAELTFTNRAEDPAESALRQDDALKSIEVLRALRGMSNQLAAYSFSVAPQSQPKLILSGVEVSVRADLWVHGASRGRDQVGGAILRMTQDDSGSSTAAEKRREMGSYVATLIRMHVDQVQPMQVEASSRLCLSIDVQHGQVFTAPNAVTRRINDLRSACTAIAALWGRA